MTSEFSQSNPPTAAPPWKVGLAGSLSLSTFLAVGVAQAKPIPDAPHDRAPRSLPQVLAQSPNRLADASAGRQASLQPSDTAIAARSIAPPQLIPAIESTRGYASEDDLIQRVTGRATVAPAKPVRTKTPAFLPPSSGTATDKRTGPAATATAPQKTPFLITAGTNSDLDLKLFAPPTPGGCGASICDDGQLPVPSLPPYRVQFPAMAQLTPPPPYSTLPTTGLPGEALPTDATATDPTLMPINSSPSSIQPPAFRTASPTPLLTPRRTLLRTTALTDPSIKLQGVYLYQGDASSARARLSISYPLTPHLLFGATFDLTDGNAFADSQTQGFNVNELYLAASLPELPNLRFVVGQLDLTSYFDRNSFAKDGATHFFNTVFQTNPALSATGIASRPGALVNWTLTDNIDARAAVFSSSRNLGDFSLDGFAGEVGIRYGNAIIRGTYATDRDAGSRDGFREIFQIDRGNGITGTLKGDREEAYGINGELFVPQWKMGLFVRYGRYNNDALNRSAETYSLGMNFLDIFAPDDRLGLAYGRGLSNDTLRRQIGDKLPDVLELFYDFRFLPNLRLGFSIQERNEFSEIVAGVRLKTEFDVTPKGKLVQ